MQEWGADLMCYEEEAADCGYVEMTLEMAAGDGGAPEICEELRWFFR